MFHFFLDEFNEKMQRLSNEYATALNRLKAVRNEFDNESRKLDDMQRRYEHFEMELDELARNRLENNDVLIKIHKEIMEQNSKVERARRELKISKKSMMKKVGNREYIRLLEVFSLSIVFPLNIQSWIPLEFNIISISIERFDDKRAGES